MHLLSNDVSFEDYNIKNITEVFIKLYFSNLVIIDKL